MKKFIAIICVTTIILLCVISCSSMQKKEFVVLEAGEYDSNSEANHKMEISLSPEIVKKDINNTTKMIKYNNDQYDSKYRKTSEGYFYRNELDLYECEKNQTEFTFGINSDTGKIDRYSWWNPNYVKEITKPELTRDENLEIARNYLAKYIDTNDYELVDEKYRDIPEYKAIYDFEFRRVINGIQTSDCAYIGVTVFGDISDHLFISLGEMADAELPSDEDMQTIRTKVEEKLKTIYDNVSDKYTVSYGIPDPVFVRLSDGKYAFEYDIDVSLAPHDNPDMPISELTKLLVYLD